MYHLCRQTMTWQQIIESCTTVQGPFADHHKKLLWEPENHQELIIAYREVLASDHPIRLDSTQAFKLQSMGLVQLESNDAKTRRDLHRSYFSDRLEEDN